MALTTNRTALVTACMTASGATNTADVNVRKHYEAIFDMVVAMLASAQVAPGTFVAPPGTAGGPVVGFGGPIT
jgi:hypothetical protein